MTGDAGQPGVHPRTLLERMCEVAARRHGAGEETARTLARATLDAEARGRASVGISHFFDYLGALQAGRLDGEASATISRPAPAVLVADCRSGLAQAAFEQCSSPLIEAVLRHGVAALSMKNCFTAGELGFYVRRLSDAGLLSIVTANTPPLMAFGGSAAAMLGTNPIAFGLPHLDGLGTIMFDQASSQTAFVKLRERADAGSPIPAGWAVDAEGNGTTDAIAALGGALLPFGGYKGGNIAYLVEILATLSGAAWSLDAGAFDNGSAPPDIGVFVLALSPAAFDPHFAARFRAHYARLAGTAPLVSHLIEAAPLERIPLADHLFARLIALLKPAAPR